MIAQSEASARSRLLGRIQHGIWSLEPQLHAISFGEQRATLRRRLTLPKFRNLAKLRHLKILPEGVGHV